MYTSKKQFRQKKRRTVKRMQLGGNIATKLNTALTELGKEPKDKPMHKVLIITADDCGPCQRFKMELGNMIKKQPMLKSVLVMIAIPSFRGQEAPIVKDFIEKNKTPDSTWKGFPVCAFPTKNKKLFIGGGDAAALGKLIVEYVQKGEKALEPMRKVGPAPRCDGPGCGANGCIHCQNNNPILMHMQPVMMVQEQKDPRMDQKDYKQIQTIIRSAESSIKRAFNSPEKHYREALEMIRKLPDISNEQKKELMQSLKPTLHGKDEGANTERFKTLLEKHGIKDTAALVSKSKQLTESVSNAVRKSVRIANTAQHSVHRVEPSAVSSKDMDVLPEETAELIENEIDKITEEATTFASPHTEKQLELAQTNKTVNATKSSMFSKLGLERLMTPKASNP